MGPTFRLQIMSLQRLIFNSEVTSVYLSGDEGEYELLAYHFPLIGALPEGEIKIAGYESVPLRTGVVMFRDNKCIIIIEELDTQREGGISWSELDSAVHEEQQNKAK